MMAHHGKKLLFMGQEFAQFIEWRYYEELEWKLLEIDHHRQMQTFVASLNNFYLKQPALWQCDFTWEGFCWIAHDDADQSVIAFRRFDRQKNELIVLCNFVPVARRRYRIGLPYCARYRRIFSSNDPTFGGDGFGTEVCMSEKIPMHGLEHSAEFDIPPLSVTFYRIVKNRVTQTSRTRIPRKASTKKS